MDAVAPFGMHLFQQLWHVGPNNEVPDGTAPWSPSGFPGPLLPVAVHEMTRRDIAELVEAFAAAAIRCRDGGLRGVEIHAAHGYLLGSFLSPLTNQREDEYGGSPENRTRFVLEVIEAVRAAVGADYVVGVRLSGSEHADGGLHPSEVARIAGILEAHAQIDFFNLSAGSYYAIDKIFGASHEPHAYQMPESAQVGRAVGAPTIVTGRFNTLAEAEAVIASGEADLVSMVRPLIADAHLVRKTREGRARAVRPCTGSNQACIGGTLNSRRKRVECVVNPAAGNEGTLGDELIGRVRHPLRVLVAGGGPAGLEAARVAARAGHAVTLYEATDELGGQLRFTRSSPLRSEMAGPISYWEEELRTLDVTVRTNAIVDRGLLEREAPDALIVATGSVPRRDGRQLFRPLDKLEVSDRLLTSWDVLSGSATGDRVVVIDDLGHYEAIDVAERLLADGRDVTFVTRHPTLGYFLEGFQNGWAIMAQPHLRHLMRQERFSFHPRTHVTSFSGGHAELTDVDAPQRRQVVAADGVVIISANVANAALADAAMGLVPSIRVVGDAAGARFLRIAVTEGHLAALSLSDSTMPETLPPGCGGGHRPQERGITERVADPTVR